MKHDLQVWVEETYDLYGQSSYSLAVRILGAGEEAEAAVVEAFKELLDLHLSVENVNVRPLVLLITRNSAITRLRRLRGLPVRETFPVHAGLVVGLTPNMHSAESHAQVLDVLAAVEPTQRRALERIFFEGQTLAETATELGVDVAEVRKALASAMGDLRDVLLHGSGREDIGRHEGGGLKSF